MELQTKHQVLIKLDDDIRYYDNTIEEQKNKVDRAERSMASKLNNLDSVNPDFKGTPQAKDIALEVEKLKSKYLLNSLS